MNMWLSSQEIQLSKKRNVSYLKVSIVMIVRTSPIIERVAPNMDMTSRTFSFFLLKQSPSVLEQMSYVCVIILGEDD